MSDAVLTILLTGGGTAISALFAALLLQFRQQRTEDKAEIAALKAESSQGTKALVMSAEATAKVAAAMELVASEVKRLLGSMEEFRGELRSDMRDLRVARGAKGEPPIVNGRRRVRPSAPRQHGTD